MILLFFALGLLFGSFINAWVWRTFINNQKPSSKNRNRTNRRHLSIINGRSVCPNCRHLLATVDLIPVLSWLILKGKCRYCHKPISIQYPAVELLTAILFILSFMVLKPVGAQANILMAFWLAEVVVLVALAVYDLRWMILPNSMLLVLGAIAVAQIGFSVIYTGNLSVVFDAGLGAIVAGGFFYALFGISNGRWMGGGDVKLAFVMGLILGLRNVLVALMLGFNLAAFISIGLIISKKLTRKSLIPFGPFLIAGTIIAGLWGNQIYEWYRHLIIIS